MGFFGGLGDAVGNAAEAVGDAIGGLFGGGGSSGNSSSSDSAGNYSKSVDVPDTRPTSRDGVQHDRSNPTQVSGPTSGVTVERGVDTNMFGAPQYGYAEIGPQGPGDDKNKDGYSDFFDANPSSTIGYSTAKAQDVVSRLVGSLMSPVVGLAGRTITNMQVAGVLPGGTPNDYTDQEGGYPMLADTTSTAAVEDKEATNPELDAKVQAVLDDESLNTEQKQVQIDAILTDVSKENQRAAAVSSVKDVAEQSYTSGITPQSFMEDPGSLIGNNRVMNLLQMLDPNAAGTSLDPSNPNYGVGNVSVDPATGQVTTASQVAPKQAAWYEAQTAIDDVNAAQGTAAQGSVSQNALIDPNAVAADMQGASTGVNADGTTNYLGQALNKAAQQKFSTILDTSTTAGKLLAQELGEGNYTDAKATMKGQMEILSREFVDSDGNPKIPSWAAGTARNVAKIAAFSGMTGTAATAAMATAMLEASLPMAQADSQFFQTVTLENLGNRQQMTLNKASVLANLNLADMDARMNAAVSNAKSFMQMDLANLDNDQQMAVLNTQSRVQTILEDARSVNAARLFSAESQNDFTRFYDQLNSNIDMFAAEQKNAMSQFNTGEINDARQFNASMERQRDMFESEMSYNIDLANARWRQTVETTNTEMKFQAAQTDVMNLVNLSTEAMNRMWDREDNTLAYTLSTSESALDRELDRYSADRGFDLDQRELENEEDAATGAAWFETIKLGGSILKGANDIFSWW